MDKQEREWLRELAKEAIDSTESGDYEWYSSDEVNASGADAAYINAMMPKRTVALLDHIDALESSICDLEQKAELVTVDGQNYQAADIRAQIKRIDALEGRLVANGEIAKPPCFICGFNGAGYFNPGAHPCAARHHAALAQAEEKGNG